MSQKNNNMLTFGLLVVAGVFSTAIFPGSEQRANAMPSPAVVWRGATPPVHQPPITPDYTKFPTKEPTKEPTKPPVPGD